MQWQAHALTHSNKFCKASNCDIYSVFSLETRKRKVARDRRKMPKLPLLRKVRKGARLEPAQARLGSRNQQLTGNMNLWLRLRQNMG